MVEHGADSGGKQPLGENRALERMHLVFYLRVFDGMSNRVVGHIVNISQQGMMLICDEPVSVDQKYRLRMRLPTEIADKDELIFSATSRWCKQDENPHFYIAGFEIHKITTEVSKYIDQLLKKFSFQS